MLQLQLLLKARKPLPMKALRETGKYLANVAGSNFACPLEKLLFYFVSRNMVTDALEGSKKQIF